MVDNKNRTSGSRWIVLAGATTVCAVAGYFAYGYFTGWKSSAYSLWCPKRRQQKPIQNAYYAQIDQNSEKVEIDARTWMVRYVRIYLKGKANDLKTPRSDNEEI